jgi:hypothetical protein
MACQDPCVKGFGAEGAGCDRIDSEATVMDAQDANFVPPRLFKHWLLDECVPESDVGAIRETSIQDRLRDRRSPIGLLRLDSH